MRIFYIANARIPTEKAHGIQIMKMCESFGQLGAEVELILPTKNNPNFEKQDPFTYHQTEKTFKIKKLWTLDPYWLMALPQGTYIKFQTLFFLFRLFFYFMYQKVSEDDFFYTRDEYLLPLLQHFSKNVVWEGHNLPRSKSRYLKYWQKCRWIVVISDGLKNELIGLGVKAEKILVSPDGVDLEKFGTNISRGQARGELALPLDKKIVIYTGHLYEWKGAAVLLKSAQLLASNSQPLFVFVGGTEHDIGKFKKEAEGLDNVLVLGHKPYSEVPKYLMAADVLVLPNSAKSRISKNYTSPMKLFEYMASTRPIVASDTPSIREVLSEKNAVMVAPDDPQALSEGIGKVLTDEKLAESISKHAREDVASYTWENRAQRILEFIGSNL